ncbi:hypothetical protein ACFPRL_19465 [Pseudoclavibacter helvolus]
MAAARTDRAGKRSCRGAGTPAGSVGLGFSAGSGSSAVLAAADRRPSPGQRPCEPCPSSPRSRSCRPGLRPSCPSYRGPWRPRRGSC